MGIQYSVTFTNNSSNNGAFCLYQTMPKEIPNLMSLAWQAKICNPGTELDIEWKVNYGAVWCETGQLSPGVIFKASEYKAVDPTTSGKNSVLLSIVEEAYMFKQSSNEVPAGNIGIYTDDTIPFNDVSIGVGMSGKPVFTIMAQPNWNLILLPKPKYWAVFGRFRQGQVLDITSMSNIVEVNFPKNKYHVNLEIDENNTWRQSTLRESNLEFCQRLQGK